MIKVAQGNGAFFSNALDSDMLIYTPTNTQRLLFGNTIGTPSVLTVSSNVILVNGDINLTNGLYQNGIAFVSSTGSSNTSNASNTGLGFTPTTCNNIFITGYNIGFGKSNPIAALDVLGSVNITSGVATGTGISFQGLDIIPNKIGITNITSITTISNIGFSNDTTGLNFLMSNNSCNNSIRFVASNIELARVTGNSCIGIGNPTPNFAIDTIGDVNFTGALTQNGTSYQFSQWSNNSSNLFIFNSNIGIGRSNPSATLDILGSINIASNLIIGNTIGFQGISIGRNNTSNISNILTTTVQGINVSINTNFITSNNYFRFIANNLEVLRITSNGTILPATTLTNDLGSSTLRFRDLYMSGNTIYLGSARLSVDSNTGFLKVLDCNNNITSIAASSIQVGNTVLSYNSNLSVTGIPNTGMLFVDSNNTSLINTITPAWSVMNSKNIFTPAQVMTIDGISSDTANSLLLDTCNNLYVCGSYNASNVNIYNCNNVLSSLTLVSNNGSFVIQYNSNGIASNLINITKTSANSICLDSNSNLYMAGIYTSNPIVYNIGLLSNNTVSSFIYDSNNSGFIAKYNSNYVALWVNNITNSAINSVITDLSNNVLTSGLSHSNSLIYDTSACNTYTPYLLSGYGASTTIAGDGTATYLDGNGTLASFNYPRGVCIDLSGNIYVADASNNVIRKITNGVVTTLAGNGTATYLDGTGTLAGFNYPEGICLDLSNNIYVTDTSNNRIRKISNGVVTTIAGSGSATYFDGVGTSAGFNGPRAIVMNNIGNLLIADTSNNRIRLLNSNGTVNTYAGNGTATLINGTGTNAAFNYPSSICIDNSNNIYISDTSNNVIRKCTNAQIVSTYITGLNNPKGVTIDSSGNLYIADTNNNNIKVYTSGTLCNLSGSGTATYLDGTGTNPGFNTPTGLCIDLLGNIYVADSSNNRIRRIENDAFNSIRYGSNAGYLDGTGVYSSFNNLAGIALDNLGNLYIADSSNNRIRKLNNAGIVTTLAGSGAATYLDGVGTLAGFNTPMGIAIDSLNNLYVSDTSNNRIRKIVGGIVTTLAGSGAATFVNGLSNIAGFNSPVGISLDSSNNIYVADTNNHRIRMISNGLVSTYAGSGTATYLDDNSNLAGFFYPCGISINSSNAYVADTSNNRIRKISGGIVSTIAGSGAATYLNALGTNAIFNNPYGITTDLNNNLYVIDQSDRCVRKIDYRGFVTTIAGTPNNTPIVTNPGTISTNSISAPYVLTFSQTAANVGLLTWSISSTGTSLSSYLNTSTGVLTIPQGIPISTETVTITATGPYSLTNSQSFSLTVTGYSVPIITNPGTINASSVTSAYTYTFVQTATNTGTLTWSISSTGTSLTSYLNTTTGVLTIPQGIPIPTATVTITATSLTGLFNSQTYILTVTGYSTPVVTNPGTLAASTASGAYTYTFVQTATNTGTLTWSITSTGTSLTNYLNTSTGVLTIPINTTIASESVTIKATGLTGLFNSQTFTFSCAGYNTPVVTNPGTINANTAAGSYTYTYAQTASFVGTLAWSITSTGTSLTSYLNTSTGVLTIPITTTIASESVTITATGPTGLFNSQTYTFSCQGYNTPIVTNPGTISAAISSSAYTLTFAQTALFVGTLTWSITSTGTSLTSYLNTSTGVLTIPQNVVIATETATITATGPTGLANSQSFSFSSSISIDLYTFTTFTFTTANLTGRLGPTYSQLITSYGASGWWTNTAFFNVVYQGIQQWTVPKNGTYSFTVAGAAGGTTTVGVLGGSGSLLTGTQILNKNDLIYIICGQVGVGNLYSNYSWVAGGGGGTFVIRNTMNLSSVLFAAGGGGGGGGMNTLISQNGGSVSGNPLSGNTGAGSYHSWNGGTSGSFGVGGSGNDGGGSGGSGNNGSSSTAGDSGGQGGPSSGVGGGGGGGGGGIIGLSPTSSAILGFPRFLGGSATETVAPNGGFGMGGGGGAGASPSMPYGGGGGGGGGYSGGGGGDANLKALSGSGYSGGGGGSYISSSISSGVYSSSSQTSGYVTITFIS
jgi:sugar lactone lactonase YvrE